MVSSFLSPIKQLKTWDDPALVAQAPFRDMFTQWKVHFQRGSSTRGERMGLEDQLLKDLASAGLQSKLQPWVDLAFNSYPGYEKEHRVLVDDDIMRLFVDIQWLLFKKEDPTPLLTRECRKRGVPYLPHIKVQAAFPPKPSLGSAEKRKVQVDQTRELSKRLKPDPLVIPSSVSAQVQRPTTAKSKPLSRVFAKSAAEKRLVFARTRISYPRNSSSVTNSDAAKVPLKPKRQQTGPPAEIKAKGSRTKPRRMWSAALYAIQREKKRTQIKKKLKRLRKLAQPSKPVKEEPALIPAKSVQDSILGVAESNRTTHMPGDDHTPEADTQSRTISSTLDVPSIPVRPPPARPSPPHVSTTESATSSAVQAQNQEETKPLPTPPVSLGCPHPESVSNWLQDTIEVPENLDSQVDQSEQLPTVKIETSQAAVPATNCPLIEKHPLPGYPPIWAQSRQEVCESFDWFRSYQGGVYHARNVARGYLLSAFSARRDVFCHGGKLIISHGGGKAQSVHTHRGQNVSQEADDQLAQDKSVRALLSNYRSRRPIVLLIDDKYALFPYDLGAKDITYAVLGFYTIVHAWAEYQPAGNERGRVVRYKFAFQWCESQGEPWWLRFGVSDAPDRPEESSEPADTPPDELECVEESLEPFEHIEQISTRCCICHEWSPQVYENAWSCLNPDCPRFWQDVNSQPLGDDLQYNSQFLQLAPANTLAVPAENLQPASPLLTSYGLTTDYAYTRGWHCKNCGRLSCRFKWEHWECMHCKAVLNVEARIHRATEFLFLTPPVSFKEVFIAKDSGIEKLVLKVFPIRLHDGSFGQLHTYRLPEGRGFIHHIKAGNPLWNWEADEIFQEYQAQASTGVLPFRRWPMRAHKCRGALLTNYFSQNAGVPYQYVGGTENTLPFDKVSSAVVRARDLIQTRVKQALDRDETFNEVLSAAYMERQRMAFHTDDEVGLGPLVAGLSLGSPALMHFRLLARHAPEGVPRSIAISFVLRHGDVLAMDGAGVQQYYEHTVVPTNFRIAATARHISAIHPKREKTD